MAIQINTASVLQAADNISTENQILNHIKSFGFPKLRKTYAGMLTSRND